jgi:hypothetical protein
LSFGNILATREIAGRRESSVYGQRADTISVMFTALMKTAHTAPSEWTGVAILNIILTGVVALAAAFALVQPWLVMPRPLWKAKWSKVSVGDTTWKLTVTNLGLGDAKAVFAYLPVGYAMPDLAVDTWRTRTFDETVEVSVSLDVTRDKPAIFKLSRTKKAVVLIKWRQAPFNHEKKKKFKHSF